MWLELSEEDKDDYSKAKKAIKNKLLPTVFSALDKFNRRLMLPGETLPLFLHNLKRLLDQAMPDLPQDAREQLLLHQFLSGLPTAISKQLRSTGENKRLEPTVERARLLMAIESDQESKTVATISENDAAKERSEMMSVVRVNGTSSNISCSTVVDTSFTAATLFHLPGHRAFSTELSKPTEFSTMLAVWKERPLAKRL